MIDNLRVHHPYVVEDWLEDHKSQIELFYFPTYSPKLNPDEYLNYSLKSGVHSGKPTQTKQRLKRKVNLHRHMLQKKPKNVASYFEHRYVNYAA